MAGNNPRGINQYSKGGRAVTPKVGAVGRKAFVFHGSNQKRLAGKKDLIPQRGDPVYASAVGDHGITKDYSSSKKGARGVVVKVARASFSKQNRLDVLSGNRNFHASKVPVKIVSKSVLLKRGKR